MENKSFFETLNPKTAVAVGILAGVGVLSTLVCLVLGVMSVQGKISYVSNPVKKATNTAVQTGNTTGGEIAVVKADKPVVELFTMTYCPYGLQMQKAFLPVMELLKDKANLSIKFVSYAMHDKQEIDENNVQYCLQEEQDDKLIAYLKCFTVNGDSSSCLKESKVNESKLNSCISATDKKFGITAAYNDKASWLSGRYPIYPVDQTLNDQYGVQGSPTLVINGAQVQSARSPEAVKQVVCAAFNEQPSECAQVLSTASASPSFGAGTGADTGSAECGT
ncbi:MAG: hypothetical protein Q7J14_01140 [Candidatus Magasanikbacteria bacterium]|nr:hypothetical protein [Candidatus Magasanikbacteria bacterium]